MPVRAKAEEEEREWDEIVRVLRDMDGCGVLGARAIAIGRASVRIRSGSSGIGSGSSAAAAPASAAAEEAEAAPAAEQHWQPALLAFSSCIRLQEISARSGSSIGVGSRE